MICHFDHDNVSAFDSSGRYGLTYPGGNRSPRTIASSRQQIRRTRTEYGSYTCRLLSLTDETKLNPLKESDKLPMRCE
jgi:hypothetical protein